MIQNFSTTHCNSRSLLKALTFCWLLMSGAIVNSSAHAQTMKDPAFAAAMNHIEAGEWPQAEGLLKFILSQNSEMHRARLELGLVYIQMGKEQEALTQFETLLATPAVPDKVKQNIRQLIAENIDKRSEETLLEGGSDPKISSGASSSVHQVSGTLQLSAGYDDNVRYSSADYFLEDDPYQSGFFLEDEDGELYYIAPDGFVYDEDGNLLFENDGFVDLGTTDRGNGYTEARITLNHNYQFPLTGTAPQQNLTWQSSMGLQATNNAEHADYNRLQLRLNTGLSWRISDSWKADINSQYRLLERDGNVQVRALSFDPEITWYNDLGSWGLGLQWMRREYEDSVIVTGELESFYEGFTNTIRGVSTKWSKLFLDGKLLLLAKLELSDSNADDGFDYKGTRITLASVYNFNEDWSLLVSASDFNQDYSEVGDGPLDDDISTLRSRLTYNVKQDLEIFLAAERSIRTSDIYGGIKSDKSLMKLGIQFGF